MRESRYLDTEKKVSSVMQSRIHRETKDIYTDHGGYIKGLDGLRALAVLSVIGYHLFPQIMRGGFLGVDIFFVLSGFLISTLLIRELRKNGKIGLTAFWMRRARRLIPALVVLIITVVPLALIVNRDLLVGIKRQVLGALTFSTNWLEIAHGSSYFDSTSPILLKNFWSLAIEEQFYLFWPLIFILILAILPRPSTRVTAMGVLALVSGVMMALRYDPDNVTRVYYGTDTHLFGLAIGIILAFSWGDRSSKILENKTWVDYGKYFGYLSLAIIIAAFFLLPDSSPFAYRGGIFLISCLTAVVIAAMLQPNSSLAKIGELAFLRWWGTRSYGLYLWHWPILVIAAAAFPAAVNSSAYWWRSFFAIIAVIVICEISFRYLETPIRKFGFREIGVTTINLLRHTLWAKIVGGIVALALILTSVGMIIAPAVSETQRAIEAAEKADKEAQQKKVAAEKEKKEKVLTEAELLKKNSTKITDPLRLSPTLDTSVPKNSEITVIGDSMFSAAKTGLDWAMPGVKFLGKSNRQWKDARNIILDGYQKGVIGRTVVLDFGTNAGVNDASQVEQIIELLGADRMILLVNLYSPSHFIEKSNQILNSVADKYANVSLVDWYALVNKTPQLLQVDQTHPSIEGANAMGNLIRSRVTEFSEQLTTLKQNKNKYSRDESSATGSKKK